MTIFEKACKFIRIYPNIKHFLNQYNMSQEKLEILFDAIKNTICTLRIQNPFYNGKRFWQPIKKIQNNMMGLKV